MQSYKISGFGGYFYAANDEVITQWAKQNFASLVEYTILPSADVDRLPPGAHEIGAGVWREQETVEILQAIESVVELYFDSLKGVELYGRNILAEYIAMGQRAKGEKRLQHLKEKARQDARAHIVPTE